MTDQVRAGLLINLLKFHAAAPICVISQRRAIRARELTVIFVQSPRDAAPRRGSVRSHMEGAATWMP